MIRLVDLFSRRITIYIVKKIMLCIIFEKSTSIFLWIDSSDFDSNRFKNWFISGRIAIPNKPTCIDGFAPKIHLFHSHYMKRKLDYIIPPALLLVHIIIISILITLECYKAFLSNFLSSLKKACDDYMLLQ